MRVHIVRSLIRVFSAAPAHEQMVHGFGKLPYYISATWCTVYRGHARGRLKQHTYARILENISQFSLVKIKKTQYKHFESCNKIYVDNLIYLSSSHRCIFRVAQLWNAIGFFSVGFIFSNGTNVYAYRLPNAIRKLEKGTHDPRPIMAAFIDE